MSREQWSLCRNLHARHPVLWGHHPLPGRCIHACCPSYIQTVPGRIRRLLAGLPRMSTYNMTLHCIHAALFSSVLALQPHIDWLLLILFLKHLPTSCPTYTQRFSSRTGEEKDLRRCQLTQVHLENWAIKWRSWSVSDNNQRDFLRTILHTESFLFIWIYFTARKKEMEPVSLVNIVIVRWKFHANPFGSFCAKLLTEKRKGKVRLFCSWRMQRFCWFDQTLFSDGGRQN